MTVLVRTTFQPESDLYVGMPSGTLRIKKDNPVASISEADFKSLRDAGVQIERVPEPKQADDVSVGKDEVAVKVEKPKPATAPARRQPVRRK